MQAESLASERVELANTIDAIEYYYEQGWTDGLPVVPATENRVREFLAYVGKAPSDIIGLVPTRGRVITAEKVAINVVMAGCLPEYMPVLIAVIEAMCEPDFNYHGSLASRHLWPLSRDWEFPPQWSAPSPSYPRLRAWPKFWACRTIPSLPLPIHWAASSSTN